MKCIKCGSELEPGTVFCGNCGLSVKQADSKSVPGLRRDRPKNKMSGESIAMIVLILVIIGLSCAIAGYVFYERDNDTEETRIVTQAKDEKSEKSKDKEDEEEPERKSKAEDKAETKNGDGAETTKNTPTPAPTPVPTPEPTPVPQVDGNGYATYYSSGYGFRCKYPSWFRVEADSPSYFSCVSADSRAKMYVAITGDSGMSPQQHMNSYINSYNGIVDFQTSGSNYFAARVRVGNTYFYRYAKLKNGNMYYFSVDFPADEFSAYDAMINYIYADFMPQFR